MPPSWRTLYELTKVPDRALANAFRDGLITPGAYAAAAAGWVEAGATIVGGCCGVGPAHVAAVREHVRRAGL